MRNSGWYWPLNLRKAHYYVDGRSVCGANFTFFKGPFEQGNHESLDNCKKCKKIVMQWEKPDQAEGGE